MQSPKRTFQERTNLPTSGSGSAQKDQNELPTSTAAPTKKAPRNAVNDNRLSQLINYYNHFDGSPQNHHHHQRPQQEPPVPHTPYPSPRPLESTATPIPMPPPNPTQGTSASTPTSATTISTTAPTTPLDSHLPEIQLLQAAINLLKAHAEDAGSSLEKLRVLLANRDLEPATYQSLQRQRFLEERRELDAHRVLWSTTQKVSAILDRDGEGEGAFEFQRGVDRSLGLFGGMGGVWPDRREWVDEGMEVITAVDTAVASLSSSTAVVEDERVKVRVARVREHREVVPLQLASKADYIYKRVRQRQDHHQGHDSAASSKVPALLPSITHPNYEYVHEYEHEHDHNDAQCTPTPAPHPPLPPPPPPSLSGSLNGRGTAAIFRADPSQETRREEQLAQRIKDVEVVMPDYVGDLMSEFDAQSNAPLLIPLGSPEKKKKKGAANVLRNRAAAAVGRLPKLDLVGEDGRIGGARGEGSASGIEEVPNNASSQPPPPPPPSPHIVKKKASQKRFSGLFSSSKRSSVVSPPTPLMSPVLPTSAAFMEEEGLGLTLPTFSASDRDDHYPFSSSSAGASSSGAGFSSSLASLGSPPPMGHSFMHPLRSTNSMSTLPEESVFAMQGTPKAAAAAASSKANVKKAKVKAKQKAAAAAAPGGGERSSSPVPRFSTTSVMSLVVVSPSKNAAEEEEEGRRSSEDQRGGGGGAGGRLASRLRNRISRIRG